jgi:hypothetical protein
MIKIFRNAIRWLQSDNPKSKMGGTFCNHRRAHGVRGEGRGPAAKKVPRIGYLSSSDPATEFTRAEAIRLALRKLRYIEGQNIAIEYRYPEGKRDREPQRASELVRLKVDIIVVAGGAR